MKRRAGPESQTARTVVTWYGRMCWKWGFNRRRGCKLLAVCRNVPSGELSSEWLTDVGEARMKRDEAVAAAGEFKLPTASVGNWAKSAPILAAYMTDRSWDDGTERLTAWMTWKVEADTWVVELNDPNYGRQLRCEELKPELLIAALESQLMLSAPPWRYPEWLKRYMPSAPKRKGVDKSKRSK